MQTFMPYADIEKSLKCLDYKRLGKQRVEAMQTYNQVTKGKGGYPHHPVNKLWENYPDSLALYHNLCINEWIFRGYKNTMELLPIPSKIELPNWFGNEELHSSHRSNLLRKDEDFYRKYGWLEPTDLDYVWL
ncbi:MAG: hypothetical protein FI674_00520 [SAR202 cluster bacterium]|nr:hypothetical protein [SAR202 cluster bacterium]|tara:strand:- start:9585 stop:9980 length:396 start_codon:yes stop_codon:yes gene_type:complete